MSLLQDVAYGVGERARAVHRVFTRSTPGPLLIRAAVALTGAAALVTAYPAKLVFGPGAALMLVIAALPALLPRGRMATVVVVLAVLGWLMSTTVFAEGVNPGRLVALSALLYLAHTLTALAAVLPYDAIVAPEALGGWIIRALAVAAGSGVVSMGLLIVTGAARGPGFLAATLAGLALAIALVALLPWLNRREPGAS
ncbi:hypothetical protein [Rhizomonospora bruguierae]|uniref:hypothetical protein n=1 Tax=Rhizomonospora bruguierae TaxID=1581705 RepID=UPI001BD082AF|nr:hypothetical protein [Micromonospora sp. NBRC 107566]